FSSRRRHTRFSRDWSSDVCSSDLSFNGSSTATPSIVDKWYFKKKLVRYTLANKEYLITSIYYPDGKLLLELINEFNKNSKRYLFYDRVNKTEINFINIKNR